MPEAKPRIAAFFPGQGSQHVGMAKDLHADFRVVRETFEEASDAIRVDLRTLCFDGPESELTLTENTQPCLLAASVAAFRVAQTEHGFAPAAVAGHSLGEYSALVAAGSLGLATAAKWVRERGVSMQRAVPPGQGTMAAVLGLEDPVVENLCRAATEAARAKRASGAHAYLAVEPVVQPANFNSPGQVVIAGSADAVDEAVSLSKTDSAFAGGKLVPLSVSAPFHCRLMAPARDRMAEVFGSAPAAEKPRLLACPYVPNRTARLTLEPGLVLELLVEQVDHPVLWKQSVIALIEEGTERAVEFGPGAVLQGLAKRIARGAGKPFLIIGVNDPAGVRTLGDWLVKS